jgi:hypothetical protein
LRAGSELATFRIKFDAATSIEIVFPRAKRGRRLVHEGWSLDGGYAL